MDWNSPTLSHQAQKRQKAIGFISRVMLDELAADGRLDDSRPTDSSYGSLPRTPCLPWERTRLAWYTHEHTTCILHAFGVQAPEA